MHLKRLELTNYRQHKKMDIDFSGNLIAVLGPNGCLAKGTPVKMFDGTIKPVEEIKSGDVLLAFDDESGQLTSSTVCGMIMTSPNHKPKPMLEVEIDGEKTCTTYDHPFFAGDGFYPLYQLVWGALEAGQRAQLKLLCEQYGAPFDDATVWQQNSCRDEACARSAWVLTDNARWAYREGTQDCSGSVAGEPSWVASGEPYRLQSVKQQGGEPGVVQREVQCVVWGNPWQDCNSASSGIDAGGSAGGSESLGGEAKAVSVPCERGVSEANPRGGSKDCCSGSEKVKYEEHLGNSVRIKVLEAAAYYTIRMREAPYTYCVGREHCYLTHNCGKSNMIGAIQFALTGAQPGFTKADLTTWGEKEGSVKLIFTAGSNDTEFTIIRKTNGDVTLKVGDETIKQTRKVEDALRDKAGLDKDLINQIVFVPQKGIDSILFDDPKNREVAFQRLIGIGNAAKIYEALRTEIAAYDRPQGFDEAIAKSRVQLSEQEGISKTCRATLEKYDSTLKQLPSKEQLEAEVDKLAGAQQAVAAYARAEQSLADTQQLHENALAKLSGMGAISEDEEQKLRNEQSELSAELDTKRKELDEGKEAVRYLTRLKELADALTSASERHGKATEELNAVSGKYKTSVEDDKAEMDRLGAAQVAAESELRSLRNLVKEASSDGTCPVCGAQASQEDIEKHLKEKMASAEEKAKSSCEKAKEARMAYDKRWAEEQRARENEKKEKNSYDIALAGLQKAKDANVEGCEIDVATQSVSYKGRKPDDMPDIQKANSEIQKKMEEIERRKSEISRSLNDIESTKKQAKDARDNVARLAAQIDLIEKNRRDCAEKLASMGIDPESVKKGDGGSCESALNKARANLDAYNGILRDMAVEKGRLEAAEKTIESTKKFIDDLVEKKELEDKVKEKVDTLKRVRDWFHYKEGPRIMSQNVMRDLTACVNSYLDQFNAPFVVEAEEEGFGFRCRFIDGRTMPDPCPDASLLSGGQKVALAIAFRMSIYMCFGAELGLLSLDEPTAYLDDASIEHLGELLQKVGEVARNKGLQILMATHEKAIMPFLDTKIDLGAMKGE